MWAAVTAKYVRTLPVSLVLIKKYLCFAMCSLSMCSVDSIYYADYVFTMYVFSMSMPMLLCLMLCRNPTVSDVKNKTRNEMNFNSRGCFN